MVTIKKILKTIGVRELSLYKGDGYYYFIYDNPVRNQYESHSVFVYRLNDLTFARWVEEGLSFMEKIEQEG